MRKHVFILTLGCLLALPLQAQVSHTRGIGIYPGRPGEHFTPQLGTDTVVRNVALFKKAWASSAVNHSLTAQLVTDGIVETAEPAWLEVVSNTGAVPLHASEWTIDGGRYSEWPLMGEHAYIEYRWHNQMKAVSGLHLTGRLAHHEGAQPPYSIVVKGSSDGQTWRILAEERADSLPGQPLKWRMHSDPNKQTDDDLLPARNIEATLQWNQPVPMEFLRIEFHLQQAAYWMLWDVDFYGEDGAMAPSPLEDINANSRFCSAWMSDTDPRQTLTVDLAVPCRIATVRLHWIRPPRKGMLLASADGTGWTPLKHFSGNRNTVQDLDVDATARFLMLMLEEADDGRHYVLSELEAWGIGGAIFTPAGRKGMQGQRYLLNGGNWTLRRMDAKEGIVATVPGTVLTSYTNVLAVPNTLAADSLLQVSDAYFNAPFCYETTFDLPEGWLPEEAQLNLDGVNWKADIWLNGVLTASSHGAFVRTKTDIGRVAKARDNLLRIVVYPPAHPGPTKEKTQLTTGTNGGRLTQDAPTYLATVGWDWIPTVRGRDMGIWNDVYLTRNRGAELLDPLVETTIGPDTLATLTPHIRIRNTKSSPQSLKITGFIGKISFEKQVVLAADSTQEIVFSPEEFPQLRQQPLPLWWPNGLGAPYRHEASYRLMDGETCIDSLHYRAGLRQVTYQDTLAALKIYVNNVRVIALGGNWGFPEANLNYGEREYDAAVAYHRQQHFNMIRNWVGQTADRAFFEACDKYGIMVWQDFWMANPADGPEPADEAMFMENAGDFVAQIRQYPSVVLYCGRNEGSPPERLDQRLRQTVKALSPQSLYISDSASGGVSGHGPYQVLPEKEYFASQTGRLHTERGLPCIPPEESLSRMFAYQPHWPQDAVWGQHDFTEKGAQGGTAFNSLLEETFGAPASMEEFARLAQIVGYNGYRAMYESSQTQRQGLLIWMSHPCWPTMVWQTYDYYLEPTAAFFGAKKACEPIHLQYNPLTNAAELVNILPEAQQQMACSAAIVDLNGAVHWTDSLTTDAPADCTKRIFDIPLPAAGTGTYFLRLTATDTNGKLLTGNTYMLSTEGNHRDLRELPGTLPRMTCNAITDDSETTTAVFTLENNTKRPMPFIRLKLTDARGGQILPVDYSDNYLTLLPAEKKQITVTFRKEDCSTEQFGLLLSSMTTRKETTKGSRR